MRTHLFLGALVVCAPLLASRHVYNEHDITPDEVKKKLPDSEKLHDRIGKKGFYEKQYATLKFTKRTSEDADLTKITLQWNGPHIPSQKNPSLCPSGALFKKTEELLPLHENQVARGTWVKGNNEQKEQLVFTFNKKYHLLGTTKFSVVLTVNAELDALLQEGSFELIQSSLPDAFQTTKKATPA